jgi:hypothetical protein
VAENRNSTNGNINEGVQYYTDRAKLDLHYKSKYGTLLMTNATTKTNQAARINITF